MGPSGPDIAEEVKRIDVPNMRGRGGPTLAGIDVAEEEG